MAALSLRFVGRLASIVFAGCSATNDGDDVIDAGRDIVRTDSVQAGDATVDAATACSAANCLGDGRSCRNGQCVDDCRPSDAHACAAGTVCDFSDGHCDPAGSACIASAAFEACPSAANPQRQCGPGLQCDGQGSCVSTEGCSGLDCDSSGRCWASACRCTRPTPRCTPATLAQLNRAEFAGSPVNGSDNEGAFALGFDDICAAYSVTMISGPDYLRQMTPDGTLTTYTSTTNLNMGEVAVLRLPGGEFSDTLGDVAATYICCATCGCIETGMDGRLGVVRLNRMDSARPLPNVLAATPTSGAGPFGRPSLDTGPYGLTWGGDRALYVGNVSANGDFSRIDLTTGMSRSVTTFAARVVAATLFDAQSLLVGLENGAIYRFNVYTGLSGMWATLPSGATSIARDRFTGRVYVEINGTPPIILELQADGSGMTTFQMPPRVGRIAIAPDGYLYHLSVFPQVQWMSMNSIVRWPLPMSR